MISTQRERFCWGI